MHNGWLPREGIVLGIPSAVNSKLMLHPGLTGDPIGRFVKKTALNPFFPLLFILAARYTKKGSDLSILHHTAYSRIQTLFYFGLVRWISGYFDAGLLNNWTKDVYAWDKEIVLITGGAGGIGGNVVKLLAEKGVKVVVMDVIPMTFDARMLSFPLFWHERESVIGSKLTGCVS